MRRLVPSSVEIDTRFDAELPTVFVDQGQVEQVVINLIVNARDAMPNGGAVCVDCGFVALHEPLVTNSATVPPGRWVQLTVRDSGVGIPVELLPRIFDPFFTTKDVGKGTGLGLSTVFGIVNKAGGVIAVDSRVGVGTRVRILFPASSNSPLPTTQFASPYTTVVTTRTFLTT